MAIVKNKISNSYLNRESLFKGLLTNIEPENLPDGFVPEVKNLSFDIQGKLNAVKAPLQIGSLTNPIKTIFMWKKDNNTNLLIVQAGNTLYKYDGTTWTSFKTFTTAEPAAFSGGFFDTLYIMHHTDGFFSYNGTTVTAMQDAPKAKYLFLWTAYLFAGGDLSENKQTPPQDTTYAPFRVRWSPIVDNSFNGWYQAYEYGGETVNNFIDFRTPENSNITGIGVWNRRIVVFTENSIEELYGYKPEAFQVNTIYKGHLTCLMNSIAYYDYVYYISPDGLCIMGKDAIKVGDAYKKYWKTTGTYYSLAQYNGNIYGNQDSDIFLYSTQKRTWEHYYFANTSYLYSSSDTLYLGTTDGKVYKWEKGSTYLPWEVKTKVINYGRSDRYKRPVQLTILHDKATTSSTVTVTGIFDDTSKSIGTFDPSTAEYHTFWISEPLFRKVQIKLSGTGEIGIKAIDLISKIRVTGYV